MPVGEAVELDEIPVAFALAVPVGLPVAEKPMLVPFAPGGIFAPLCVLLGAVGGSERPLEPLTQ